MNFILAYTPTSYYGPTYTNYAGGYGSNYNTGYNTGYNTYPNYNTGYNTGSGYSGYDPYSSNYNGNYNRNYVNGQYTSNYNPNYNTGNTYPNYNSNSYGYNSGIGGYSGGYNTGYGSSNYTGYALYGSSVNPQFTNPGYGGASSYLSASSFWSSYNTQNCAERRDVIMQIMPGGCSPAVVRSDLLEEQNVPVFCKVMTIKANPLIDVSKIRSISFKGQYPKGVSGISYFPARAALRTSKSYGTGFTSSAVNTEAGYMVVVLSQIQAEKDMPESIQGNITAVMDYDSEGSYGIGNTNFYLSEINDDEWQSSYKNYGFWNGKAYVRADAVESDRATISIYGNNLEKDSTVTLMEGQTSTDIYLNGFYCAAGMNIRLDRIGAPIESALLQINDEQIWVAKGDRIINNMCRVIDLQTSGAGGKVKLSCPSKNGNIELSLNPGKASFNFENNLRDFALGEKIFPEKNIYLAYMGQDFNNRKYAVLIRDDFSATQIEFADKQVYDVIDKIAKSSGKTIQELESIIKKAVSDQYRKKLNSQSLALIDKNLEIQIVPEGKKAFEISLDEAYFARDKAWISDDINSQGTLAKEYYDKSIKYYDDLADFYKNERRISEEDPYAAVGLYESAKMSKAFGMNAKATELFDRLVREYPDSNIAKAIRNERDMIMRYDMTNSKTNIAINNEAFYIELLDFKKPGKTDLSTVLLIDGKEETFALGEIKTIRIDNQIKTIQIIGIEEGYIVLKYDKSNTNSSISPITKTEKLDLTGNTQTMFEGINVKLVHINLNKQAKVEIIPKNFGPRAETSFTFRIDVEKRAIQLTPEQTKAMIDALKASIQQWTSINQKLGMVISAMKAACFATSSALTIKNLLEGAEGGAIGRTSLMTSSGGWNDVCEKLVSENKYQTLQQCLMDKSSDIDKDVKLYSDNIKKTNTIIQGIEKQVGIKSTSPLDFTGQVDSKKVEEEFKKKFDDFCKNTQGSVTLSNKEKTSIPFNGQDGLCTWDGLTHEQRRDIMTYANMKNSGGSSVLSNIADKELGNAVLTAKNSADLKKTQTDIEKNTQQYNLGINPLNPVGENFVLGDVKTIGKGDSSNSIYGNFVAGSNVVRVYIPVSKVFGGRTFTADSEVAGKEVLVEVVKSDRSGTYTPLTSGKIISVDGKPVTGKALESVRNYMGLAGLDRIKQTTEQTYHNPINNPDSQLVKYFETAPFKGLPSEVIFDVQNGWYVEMTYVINGFGVPYDESGRAVNFYVCNVGANGIIEFKQSGDDICRYYNAMTGAEINFPGLNQAEARNLVVKAQQAIIDAAKQYGKSKVTINGRVFGSGKSFGGGEGRCTDFMSPSDCNILFNVCDPVICPSSRCDLGGKFRVDNVIASGIIGSLTLCLPNMKEGIMIPVCLSGVHAGLESYISILNSTVDCLEESLRTGRNIGICDEIKSFYICDFFWKQALPFLNAIIPTMLQTMYGQGVRGGGEYTTVTGAWNNMNNAISYFNNQYAVNSVQAFNMRSLDAAGSGYCQLFVSNGSLGISDVMNRLIEPDSPPQYSAWFSEDVMTTATIPPTSHYKAYYHIYAGNDYGAYYSVYLKNIPEINQVMGQTYLVASGFIAQGASADEAKDFVAPSGYKQLCINVNGKDECGFGKVSTSYALNSLSDSYAQEQLKTGISSEKECVAGIPTSTTNIAIPNAQATIEQANNPQIYNQGIIRICATENPGKKVLPTGQFDTANSTYDRWKQVGYCDDPTIKCWLDTNSVKNVIQNKDILKSVLDNVDLSILGEDNFWTNEMSITVANSAEQAINDLTILSSDTRETIESKISNIVSDLDRLSKLASTNVHRARALYLTANLYRKVAETLLPRQDVSANAVVPSGVPPIPVTSSDFSDVPSDVVTNPGNNVAVDNPTETFNSRPLVFEFQDGLSAQNIYYTFDKNDEKWYWSLQKNPSSSGWNLAIDVTDNLSPKNQGFIKNLAGKTCNDGLKLLVGRVIQKDEGGFLSPALVVYGQTKSRKFNTVTDKTDCTYWENSLK